MADSIAIQLGLKDLLADLQFARKNDELGRLALLAHCDVKGWARRAGKADVADKALQMFSGTPAGKKAEFLHGIDELIATLALHLRQYQQASALPRQNAPVGLVVAS